MSCLKHFDHIFDSILALDRNGEIIYFNNQASVFFKLPPRLLKQKTTLGQILKVSEMDLQDWLTKGLKSTDVSISPETRVQLIDNPDTEYSVIMKLIPFESYSALFFQDKTLEKGLHLKYREQVEELRKTHNQIVQADKLTILGELTANISHEINNPLTIAAGHSEVMSDFLASDDVASYLPQITSANKVVRESLERVNQIIRNMKDFLHQNEDQKEYCNVEALINTAVEWVNSAAKSADIKIQQNTSSNKIVALANRVKIEQVLINLIKNSIDALKENNQQDSTIKILVSKSEAKQQTVIDIIDNGPGLPASIKENLFRPFMTTKGSGNGTGLGLSICSKIIESHQGKLEHVPTSSGCHFRITLPLIEIYSYGRNDMSLLGATRSKRILVLDNEVQILNVLNTFIKDSGLVFIGSSDPRDAIEFLTKASVDLVITDYSMPEMTGSEFAQKARDNGYEGPILYMTSSKFIENFNKDKEELGLDGLLVKPFNKDDVMKVIRRALKEEP